MKQMKKVFLMLTVIGFVVGLSGFALAEDTAGAGTININTASAAELTKLKGVGEKLAASIVAHREANGPFKTVDDIVNVKGIGPKILADNAAMMTVGAPAAPAPPATPAPPAAPEPKP